MMRKKLCYFVVIFLLTMMVSGCKNGDVTRGIRHAGFTISDTEFDCSEFLPNKEDGSYTKIWYYDGVNIITENGLLYDVSLDKKFSNGTSCKRADFTKSVVAILDNKVMKANDNKIYYMAGNGNNPAYSQVPTDDNSYPIYQILFNDPDISKIVTVDQNAGIYYALKRDGNVYKMVISRDDYNQPFTLRSSEIIYSKGSYGAIWDFYYSTNLGTNYIRTNTTIHRSIASNGEECSKYADIVCQYQMKEDVDLANYMDQIIVFNGSTLITKYGKIFTVAY